MSLAACPLPRPTDDEDVGPESGPRRLLLLVQTWDTPSGTTGELVVEPHGGHVHVWWRWDQDWGIGLPSDEDWDHFVSCVAPVVRDVVKAFRCCAPLDASSAELLA